MKTLTLEEKRDYLKNKGYNVTIPCGANCISVMGMGNKYFKAKQIKANGITHELNCLPITVAAWNMKHIDGYYDFYLK